MAELSILIGIIAIFVYGLGLVGLINYTVLRLAGIGLLFSLVILIFKKGKFIKNEVINVLSFAKKDKLTKIVLLFFILSILINFIGALGPEIGFDALWYHLTIPKIYLKHSKIFFIPGGLFYYSAMPKLTEMLYLISLSFSPDGQLAKIIHFLFGILSAFALFKLSKKFFNTRYSLFTSLLFYTTLIVGWESITAYVDLARCFFELVAIDLLLNYFINKNKISLIESSLIWGLSISVKLLSLASFLASIFLLLLSNKKPKVILLYVFLTLIVVSPWLLFSYINTKNPIYPIFSSVLDKAHSPRINLAEILNNLWNLFYKPQDPHTFLFLAFFPIIFWFIIKRKLTKLIKMLFIYFFLCTLLWALIPNVGGSRFFLPYIPILCIIMVFSVEKSQKFYKRLFIYFSILNFFVNVSYRFLANLKYIPVLLGKTTKESFLIKNLDFQNGDFYDIGGEIRKIVKDEYVLIYGSHNLFYANFNFLHESYAPKNFPFAYLLVQNVSQPDKNILGNLLYDNEISKVKLYYYRGNIRE